jgi:uncharacterized protein YbjT (DUF2867 family)
VKEPNNLEPVARVLVTGGTGVLGSYLVPCLRQRGHEVSVLSRRASPELPAGAVAVPGDVRTGRGLREAAAGVDVVIHAATSPRRRVRETEVEGTRQMLAAAGVAGAHFVYVSIVGVDQMSFPYYRAKWAAEQLVEGAASPWAIQRATQFHDLLDMFLGMRLWPSTRHMAFQTVAATEVSDRLADVVEGRTAGRLEDFGGPEVLPIRELVATRRRITGRTTVLLPAPRIGFLRQFDEGRHLCPDHRSGRLTWEAWLGERGR